MCICANVLRVICYQTSYDANVSLGECKFGVHMPKGGGLVCDRGLNNDMGEARGELSQTEYWKSPHTHAHKNNLTESVLMGILPER